MTIAWAEILSLFSGAKMKVYSNTAEEFMQAYIAFLSARGEKWEKEKGGVPG